MIVYARARSCAIREWKYKKETAIYLFTNQQSEMGDWMLAFAIAWCATVIYWCLCLCGASSKENHGYHTRSRISWLQ